MGPAKFARRSYGAPTAATRLGHSSKGEPIRLWDDRPPVLGEYRPRGMRKPIRVAARYRDDEGWHECEIRDVSSRGLGGKSPSPPDKGSYIEIAIRNQVLFGRVIWRRGPSFGVRLATAPRLSRANGERIMLGEAEGGAPVDRKPSTSWQDPVPQSAQDAMSKWRRTEFLFLLMSGLSGVALLASLAYVALAMPVAEAPSAPAPDAGRD